MESTADDLDDGQEDSPNESPPRLRRSVVVATGAICFLLFELTANPAISVAVACVEFGWDQFRKARWLRRHDPDPIRARVCSRFYLASAFWKMSMGAMLAIACLTAFVHLSEEFGWRSKGVLHNDEIDIVLGAVMVIIPSFFITACIANAAVVSALRRGIKVWVGRWSNRANLIVLTVLVIVLFALAGILTGVIAGLAMTFPNQLPTEACAAIIGGLFLGMPLFLGDRIHRFLKDRVIASSSEECGHDWPGHTSPWLL